MNDRFINSLAPSINMATQIMNGNNNLESTTAVKNMDRRVLASGDEQDRTNVAQFCACCLDECPNWDVTQLSCSHFWCRDCAQRLFQASLDSPDDPALFPPRCCDPVPLSACRFFLAPATIKAFTQRTEALAALRGEEEKSTPPQERVYCHRPACSAFVPHSRYRSDPADGEETVAPCPRPGCGASTCVRCKKEAHGALDCPEDPAFKQLLEVANERGWKQCPKCRRMVEKDSGCNRMSKSYPPLLSLSQAMVMFRV